MELGTWITIGVIIFLNAIGWVIAYSRYSRNEAMHLGRIEGKVDGLDARMGTLEERMNSLDTRLDGFLTSKSGDERWRR